MTFTHSMWVSHTLVLAWVLMLFIPDSASKPQGGIDLPEDDNEFINLLVPEAGQGCPSLSETCVPFDKCCDPKPTDRPNNGGILTTDPQSGAPNIFGIVNPKAANTCCDLKPTDRPNNGGILTTDSQSGAPNIFDIVNPKAENTCSGLFLCCEIKCAEEVIQCGIQNIETDRVTLTGKDSTFGEFPWMVAVLTQGNSEYVGGGSLVHRRVVLTAAHTVHGKSGFVARIGDWDLSAKTGEEPIAAQNINVKKVVPHPQFSLNTLINNVALLILESDAVFGSTVMPICLPEPNLVFDGLQCIVTGWGKNELETGTFSKVLKKVKLPAVNHNDCQSMLRNTRLGPDFNLHNTFNCAGGEGEDSCEGDGGSPLICPKPNKPNEYVQMGVTAWGIGCGIKGNPGVYGSVPKTVDWIHQVIKEEGGTKENTPRG